jgi:hypothetical protein
MAVQLWGSGCGVGFLFQKALRVLEALVYGISGFGR